MSKAQATTAANELREVLLSYGVPTTIELVEGRGGAGWFDDKFVGTLAHHIVSTRSQGLTPGLALVKRGRQDLPGPLCNGYGGFDYTARIICMGWANHAGQGGPWSTPSGVIPANNGRPYLFGWEFEGGLKDSDWPVESHEFMARCLAATLDYYGVSVAAYAEHKNWATPPGRKTDRRGYTREAGALLIGEVMAWTSKAGYKYTDDEQFPPFEASIKWAIDNGILVGDRNEDMTATFAPDTPVTRSQLASALYRVAKDSPTLLAEIED